MDIVQFLLNFILHLDQHLIAFVNQYGIWVYFLLFFIIFCETGIFFMAILPGDSLLFAAGALTASVSDTLSIHILMLTLLTASILGNCLNYAIGKWLGPKVFYSEQSWLFNPKYLKQAHAFYERYGGKTIIIARFLPIVRTFAPFIAGLGYMTFRQFLTYTAIGAILWIGLLLYGSFLFGNIPIIKEHFSYVIIGIMVVSILPAVFEIGRQKFMRKSAISLDLSRTTEK